MPAMFSRNDNDPRLLIGTYTEPAESNSKGVYLYSMDRSSGELSYEAIIEGMPNVSFMAKHPQSGLLYAVNETEEFGGEPGGGVSVLSNQYKLINRQTSAGIHPCYLSIEGTGHFVLVANYTSGRVAMLPIAADGSLLPSSHVVQHVGSSVHPERQEGPHPHRILPDRANRFAIVADLGLDKLIIYRMDREQGKLHAHAEVALEAGSGPRHLIFDAQGQHAYLLNELNSTLIAYQYDSELAAFTELQILPTLPEIFSGENYCSDLHFSADGRFLYVSNRGHNSIVCFSVDANTRELTYQSHVASGGNHPRVFAIDPSGRFLMAAHQRSNNVVVFQIDPVTGHLSHTGHEAEISMPVHVLFL